MDVGARPRAGRQGRGEGNELTQDTDGKAQAQRRSGSKRCQKR